MAPHMSGTRFVSVTNVIVAMPLLVAALSGCAPSLNAVPVSSPAVMTRSAATTSADQPAPEAWTTVTDPGSGATVSLPGPPRIETRTFRSFIADLTTSGMVYSARGNWGLVELRVLRKVSGAYYDLPRGTKATVKAYGGLTLVDLREISINGHPAVDFRASGFSASGRPTILLGRTIGTPSHEIQVVIIAVNRDKALVERMYRRVVESLRVS